MNYKEIEIEWMKEILRDKEEEIKKLKDDLLHYIRREEELQQEIRAKESWRDLYREQLEKNKKQEEKIRFLEECLDNKEKVNQSLREELGKMVKDWK